VDELLVLLIELDGVLDDEVAGTELEDETFDDKLLVEEALVELDEETLVELVEEILLKLVEITLDEEEILVELVEITLDEEVTFVDDVAVGFLEEELGVGVLTSLAPQIDRLLLDLPKALFL
jgi:hypothetical protein